ncbi:juvenile hormone esterase-like isoform X2 [Armigeres subalbatus]|uniref:juvenile hormone esterase-like isoform X2 n=1 Tax=Armigeres subalbatus TaxID=124917 RepID=UPI002ED69CD7
MEQRSGSSTPSWWSHKGIVIVTINYRLDVLGFLRYPKFNISGNYGLGDQQTALQWIRKYIEHFGGDTNKVTVMGHSAGASSVNYHMYSNKSAELFHQAILLSGNFLMPHAFVYEPEKYADYYFRQLGISTRDQLIDRDFKDYFFLNDTSRTLGTVFASMQFPCFLPTIDGVFVTDSPHQLILQNASNSGIPMLVGTTSNEFLFLLNYVKGYFSWDVNFPNRNNESLLAQIEGFIQSQAELQVQSGFVSDKEEFFRNLANYANMVYPVDDFIERTITGNQTSSIYRYRFDFDGKFAWYKNEFYRSKINTSHSGAMHGDDLGYIFTPYNVEEALEHQEDYVNEWRIHRRMTTSVSNFVKHG